MTNGNCDRKREREKLVLCRSHVLLSEIPQQLRGHEMWQIHAPLRINCNLMIPLLFIEYHHPIKVFFSQYSFLASAVP